jgi:secondary thiamine-phosphate synthase enzyme
MVTANRLLTLRTSTRRELVDITDEVLDFVKKAPVKSGLCLISAPHATAAIISNENEHGLIKDLLAKIEDLFPISASYAHNAIDDNADAHVAGAFLGHSKAFPVSNGRVVRGTWQNIFLVELDGPRARREVHLTVLGDS